MFLIFQISNVCTYHPLDKFYTKNLMCCTHQIFPHRSNGKAAGACSYHIIPAFSFYKLSFFSHFSFVFYSMLILANWIIRRPPIDTKEACNRHAIRPGLIHLIRITWDLTVTYCLRQTNRQTQKRDSTQ